MIQQETLDTRALPDEQRAGLLALVGRLNAALTQQDAKAFAAQFAEDSSVVNPAGEYARGRTNVEALLRSDFSRIQGDSRMELSGVRLVSPTVALVDLEHHIDRAPLPDGTVGPIDVHVASIARRAGATWEVLDARAYMFVTPPKPLTH